MSLFYSFLTLVSMIQGAPADVPKNHWAYGAVNELFENRLLDGYPAGALKIDGQAKYDQKTVNADIKRWKEMGLLFGYPDGLGYQGGYHGIREPSNYEYAVAIHAICANIKTMAVESRGSEQKSSEFAMKVVPELPKLVHGMSMVRVELGKLGADMPQMLLDLNRLWPSYKPTFQG